MWCKNIFFFSFFTWKKVFDRQYRQHLYLDRICRHNFPPWLQNPILLSTEENGDSVTRTRAIRDFGWGFYSFSLNRHFRHDCSPSLSLFPALSTVHSIRSSPGCGIKAITVHGFEYTCAWHGIYTRPLLYLQAMAPSLPQLVALSTPWHEVYTGP